MSDARISVGGAFALEAEAEIFAGADGVVVCHPHPAFGGRMDNPLVVALADGLAAAGLSTVRFNFRGVGASGGEPTGGRAEHDDVRAAAAWLREAGAQRVGLLGYSFGALMAMKAIAAGERVVGCAAVGFPSTILGETGERVEQLVRALDGGAPWLFVSGDADPFAEVARLREWAARPSVRLELLPGAGHFFAGAEEKFAVAQVASFFTQLLTTKRR